ncbi:MAG TPA: helix-turn-helix transcriptional regulator [Caulobacteraceae bacterium]|nr:helix-turn-helix transcriptional regulator [Caulobacteraceae bacterium]
MAGPILFTVAHAGAPERDVRRTVGGGEGPPEVMILNGRGRVFEARGAGGFSIKWMAEGRSRYEIDRRVRTIARETAILVDQDQPYGLEFEARREAQSFCLFFRRDLVEAAWASLEQGLDGEGDAGALRAFPSVPFAPPPALTRALDGLHRGGPEAEDAVIEEGALQALAAAIAVAGRHRGLADRVPARRPAVRAHLTGLVERTRERLEAADGVGLSLERLALEAGLSRFHLLRLFKALHGVTPMAYAERLRMQSAARRLRSGAVPVGEVAAKLGYDSPSAFARAFRRWTGQAPTSWRT